MSQYKYTYVDENKRSWQVNPKSGHGTWVPEEICTIQASDITEADKKYYQMFKQHPMKQSGVAVAAISVAT